MPPDLLWLQIWTLRPDKKNKNKKRYGHDHGPRPSAEEDEDDGGSGSVWMPNGVGLDAAPATAGEVRRSSSKKVLWSQDGGEERVTGWSE